MSDLVIQLLLAGYLLALIWFSIAKAMEDGFFSAVCTFVALLVAFRVADREWKYVGDFFEENLGTSEGVSMSAAYWTAFLLVIMPAMLCLKWMTQQKTPFPAFVERYGSMVSGALAGTVLFAVTIRWIFLFDTVQARAGGALAPFMPIFNMIRG